MTSHPGDALVAELLDTFPGATLVADDDGPPRWETAAAGARGTIHVRDVPAPEVVPPAVHLHAGDEVGASGR